MQAFAFAFCNFGSRKTAKRPFSANLERVNQAIENHRISYSIVQSLQGAEESGSRDEAGN